MIFNVLLPPEYVVAQFPLARLSLSLSLVVNSAVACPPAVKLSANVDLTSS